MSQPELRRTLGLTSAIAIVVGGVIGSGIFFKPLGIAQSLPSAAWVYGVWAGLGVICLFGAFAYAELGTLFPEAGGQYAFIREGWGRFVAFLYGWVLFLVINTGTLAALAVGFAVALQTVWPMGDVTQAVVASGMVLLLAVVNHFGVGWGAVLQNVSTFAKVAALGAIVVGGFAFAGRAPAAAPTRPDVDLLAGLVRAAMAIFWAYEGWYQLPFSAAELKNPHRDLPRGLIYGTLLLIVIYVLVNAAYLQVIAIDEMRTLTSDADVPHLAVERVFGAAAAGGLAFLLCLSVFGAANPGLLSTPRAFYAMAQDGLVWRGLMTVHPVWRTPTAAIWTQAVWTIGLIVVLKTFRDITDFVIFAALIFYALTVASLYVQRRRLPDWPRAYRCWGYPVTPALFIAVLLFVDWQTLLDPESRKNALIGLGIIAAGAVFYAPLQRLARS